VATLLPSKQQPGQILFVGVYSKVLCVMSVPCRGRPRAWQLGLAPECQGAWYALAVLGGLWPGPSLKGHWRVMHLTPARG